MAAHETARVTRADLAARLRGVYLIVNDGAPALAIARAALDAGVRIVQYRAKLGIVSDRLRALRRLTAESGALLIVNDDWRAAIEFDCDGVHLGPEDRGFTHADEVREALGARLIGLSCGTVEEARDANARSADYAGVGPVYATVSKSDAGAPIGIEGLQRVAAATQLPVAAIGGVAAHNLADVARAGVAMAAVISSVADAADPAEAAAQLVRIWSENR